MTGTAGVTSQGGVGQGNGSSCQDDFDRAFRNAQAGMSASMNAGTAANGNGAFGGYGSSWGGLDPGGYAGSGMGGLGRMGGLGGLGYGPAPAAGGCARTGGSSCGCNGNVSSFMGTTSGGAPLSSFDFMSGSGTATMGGMGGMGTGMGAGSPDTLGGYGGFGGVPRLFNGYPPVPSLSGNGISAQPGMMNGMSGMAGMGGMGGMHSMGGMGGMGAMHDGHGYYALDGIGMVHAKDQLRDGAHLTDNRFFERVANGQFGAFSGVSLDQAANGDLEGRVYISGHPAAFHQLYDEGRAQGLAGEALNQYIAEELTNVNDIDDIDQRYYDIWEARGYPPPTRDHDLHNTGSIAAVLRPGQSLSLTGAHQYDTIDDETYNFTDVQTDERGTFVELYRLSNNNDSGNGHHEDLVLAAKIYLDQNEIERLANGADPLDIANARVRVDDDADDYRISTGAIRMMAYWGMPIY
ncbi:hypothetical protein [Salinarimonas chemoclinalis]|uniref:hypothetical protein n=1 Tax=Salinarimonas chemoclinalis TaxID=3241599 RepID=UPI003558D5E0